jgi:NADH-quinone oxidoreductase subunit H
MDMVTAAKVFSDIGWGLFHYIIFYPPVYQFIIIPGLVAALVIVVFMIWFERKAAARVQMRYGPLEISPRTGGAPQLIADLIRYTVQELIIPSAADFFAFIVAPNAMLILSLLPMVAVPMTSISEYWPIPMGYSLLIAVALSTLAPIFTVVMAWASNNKFSVLGGVRESFIIVAYELIAVISLLSVVPLLHTFNLVDIVNYQMNGIWLGLLNPIALLDLFIAILMSTSGFPFEIPDSETELVAGPFTEYSGLIYGINMGGGYIRRWAFSVLMTLVFLGGWAPYRPGPGILLGYFVPSLIVVVKATIVMAIMSFLRAVYGRYRLDQALSLAWEVLIPLAFAAFGISVAEAFFGVHP